MTSKKSTSSNNSLDSQNGKASHFEEDDFDVPTSQTNEDQSQQQQHVIIPGSRRPDGTFRKDIKVRAGYTPLDEVPRYESTGKKFMKEVKEVGIPGIPNSGQNNTQNNTTPKSKTQKKNESRKLKRQAAAKKTSGGS